MNKRAFVTGGSRGIGKAVCLMLAKNNYDVLLNFKNDIQKAEETKKEIEKLNANCKLLQFDVSDFDNAKKTLENELETSGNIDVLVFNAGIKKDSLFPVMNKADWDNIIDVNLKSFYYIVNPIISGMFKQGFGKIIVMSSTAGITGMSGQANYCASKYGIIGASKALAIEVARRNINVNVIAPGFIETEMIKEILERKSEVIKTIPARRLGTCEDVANVVEFLISEKASYINGQVIPVNGGIVT